MNVLSTYRILAARALGEAIGEDWIDWAIGMVEAGYESMNLYMLAGMPRKGNSSELQELADKTLKDLHLDAIDTETVLRNYVHHLISHSINRPETYLDTLRALKDLSAQTGIDSYTEFFLLYWAKADLLEQDTQYYWEGASAANIDLVVRERFEQWLKGHPLLDGPS